MNDPYEILGVDKAAAPEAIRKAYHRLAKKLHPDLNPGDKNAESRFKEVAGAYDLLSDAEKRRRFDAGEIDASGAEKPQQKYYRDYAGQGADGDPYEDRSGYADFADADDILAQIFRRQARRARGADRHYGLAVDFLDAINGATRRIDLPEGGSLDVTIPAGIQQGQTLRLRGKGAPAPGEGEAGDALVEVSIHPHPFFTRHGENIHLDLPVTFAEAVLGGEIRTPTPAGPVMLKVPKGSNSGTALRLKGKGAPRADGRGDLLVKLKIMAPSGPDPELEAFLAAWKPANYDPRKGMPS
ncbi:J domain-containing protein [uncultured Rhodoblastus sp.]|uniref:J domain-containing protein n=1 Tax=uncultured Rhodoblastus sp. TaxID=543037 RepID=UPI0025D623E8|nr:J domain-containing protein [uncultured Rhodoblastus sp.]